MTVLQQFLNHIDQNKLCSRADNVLLAISGGIDSMVMLHLFKEAGYKIGVVHCNFQLRDEESQGDEAFVRVTCKVLNVPIHVKHFETNQFAEQQGISTQMAARELRYAYFNELMAEFGYTYLATAHHVNDNLETVLLNLVRGTGIEGLGGIAAKNNHIIRPLLFASREMIENYAMEHQINWREDSSNAADKYHRNLIRNQVVPLLKKINPNLEDSFQHSVERIQGATSLVKTALMQFRELAIRESEKILYLDKFKLHELHFPAVMLWEILKEKNFNFKQCKEIMSTDHQSGKVFYSNGFQLTVDRHEFVISPMVNVSSESVLLERGSSNIKCSNKTLVIEEIDYKQFTLQKLAELAQLDADLLQFPLTWRTWKPGDKFTPLGMKQQKKLSDFLIDVKMSLPDKDRITVLESRGEIVWVVGQRINDRFKVTDATKRVWVAKLVLG